MLRLELFKTSRKSLKLEKIIEERMSLTPAQVIQRRNELNEQIDLDTIEKVIQYLLFVHLPFPFYIQFSSESIG